MDTQKAAQKALQDDDCIDLTATEYALLLKTLREAPGDEPAALHDKLVGDGSGFSVIINLSALADR